MNARRKALGTLVRGPEGGAGLSLSTGEARGHKSQAGRLWRERSVSDSALEDETECVSEQVSRYARGQSPASRRGRSRKATKISALRISPQSGWISFGETEEPVGSVSKRQETTSF